MNILKIITSTTRPGRKGRAIADWMTGYAKENGKFNVDILDLGEINLPLLDEPNHPRLQKYQQEHTKNWSNIISGADAFVIVLAEYNNSYPAPIKNALDFLFNEWKYKPVGLVSYGGISAGLRAVQALKPVLNALNMVPLVEAVTIPMFTNFINDEDEFQPNAIITQSAHVMLNELDRWTNALKSMRQG